MVFDAKIIKENMKLHYIHWDMYDGLKRFRCILHIRIWTKGHWRMQLIEKSWTVFALSLSASHLCPADRVHTSFMGKGSISQNV